MKERIISIIITIVMAFILIVSVTAIVSSGECTDPATTISEDYIPSETTSPIEEEVIILENQQVERVEPTTYQEANELWNNAMFRNDAALLVYENLLVLGYAENHPAVEMAKRDIEITAEDVAYYEEQVAVLEEQHKWEVRAAEYPVATEVWFYMKNELGFNDIVCAGIMGNMMAECGGCWTSDLNWDANSASGYGMIQWLGGRKKQLFSIYGSNPSIENQLDFMKDELYGTNGVTKQVTDSQLNKIMNAESPEECAFAFATYFERCAEGHRSIRRGYARRAYEYFVG